MLSGIEFSHANKVRQEGMAVGVVCLLLRRCRIHQQEQTSCDAKERGSSADE
jgi:hypothetical protein